MNTQNKQQCCEKCIRFCIRDSSYGEICPCHLPLDNTKEEKSCCGEDMDIFGWNTMTGITTYICHKCGKTFEDSPSTTQDKEQNCCNIQERGYHTGYHESAKPKEENKLPTPRCIRCGREELSTKLSTKDKQEDWEEEFDRTWINVNGITVLDEPLKDFIRQTLHSAISQTREETLRSIIVEVEGMKINQRKLNPDRNNETIIRNRGYNHAIDDIKATLQNKLKE